MISGVGASPSIQSLQTPASRPQAAPESSGALPDAASPFEIAQQIQEVQVNNLKRTLDAQTQVLDLLV